MDIISFRTFLAAAATGSFAGAAKRIHASPSSVTERIKQLEYRLGAKLFERDKRGCRLTAAGRKFMGPAQQSVRAWEIAQHEVSIPENFTKSISMGGQYALWGAELTGWLATARKQMPHIAFRVTAGASARLNRDLSDGFLDIAAMYDPVFRPDIGTEKLFDDRLILVSAAHEDNWRENYVRIEWGQHLGVEIASRMDIEPSAGLVLDLGKRSANWLIEQKMSGFMPERVVMPHLKNGQLKIVPDALSFDYPAYICWRRDVDPQIIADLVLSIKACFAA
ncbi:LysR family transcriptional regulator [Sphingorhabdus lutea]|uniref:LysR family transcriptional regulator n=1 Tax=Sphingorhabdus lutea TaxID=1913578 RepID=A0A1L3JA69_9SPHN|nr:LysR family transcriptional regulator [Sphingorhabdus lutea]APG62030.1 LysR family transcriptional regulator [Sphingorhabdus lutea]